MKTHTLARLFSYSLSGLLLTCVAIAITLNAHATDGTWTNLVNGSASGSWSTAANWNNGAIANGTDATADFSTLDIGTNSTVTLDAAQNVGNLIFGDNVTAETNWIVNASSTNTTLPTADGLTLATSSGSPTINVTNQTTTFNAPIYGANGFVKSGPGTLRLNNANTNAASALFGIILVTNGDLQCGNGTLGVLGNQNSANRAVVASGATIEVIPGVAVNNKNLTVSGTGVGGMMGAIYASPATNTTSTRWGLSAVNDSGTSGNSSASFPAITLAGDTTIRVDGANFTYQFIAGYTTGSNTSAVNFTNSFYTLTKTGGGRLSLDRGAMVSNIVVNAGCVTPNAASGFNAVQAWTVNSGGQLLTWQNNCYNIAASVTVNSGGIWDINGRSDTAGTGYTETIGALSGSGTITHGENMPGVSSVATLLAVNSNSIFDGPVQTANGILNITKNSAGTTLQFNGANTYNGITTVSAGTLLVDGSHVGGSNYVVNPGAVLGGKGTILPAAPNAINLSGSLIAGDGGGTLTVSNLTGAGDVYVTNAGLVVLGQLNNASSGYLNSLNLTNGTLTALMQQDGTDASIYANSLNVDGVNNTLKFTTANPAVGQFPFIKYLSIGGLNGFAGLNLSAPAGFTAFLSNNIANSSVDIVITAIPALVWQGTPTGDWTNGGPANWLNGATPTAYTETAGQGPFVIFDDTAPGAATVNVATNVNPEGITVNSSSRNYTFTGSNSISCSGNALKDGTSTLTFANTTANGLTNLTINNGAVALGNGGTAGNVGAATIANSGQLIFNRSDDVTFSNVISGTGSLVKNSTDTVTLTGVGNIGGSIVANAGTLALGPAGTITVSGDVSGSGAFGINSAGKVILSSWNITYSGGSLISGGTLEFDNAFPPGGNILDNGTLALGASGTLNSTISGTGGVTLLNGAYVTLGVANSYSGPTLVLGGGSLSADAINYPAASALVLGSTNAAADTGSATFTAGNPVLGGLTAGGNNFSGDPVSLPGGQTITIDGNLVVGNVGPASAAVYLPITSTGPGASIIVNTNGGTIQIGLGATGSGVNPDNVLVDFSTVDNFIADLGTNGVLNMGTTNGNPGPSSGATVVNQFKLAGVSNAVIAGTMTVGAGGRQLVPELFLGAGTNVLDVNTFNAGGGGLTSTVPTRDGSYVHFNTSTGGLQLRANDGVSRAVFNVGVNPSTATGASITNTVDFTGHPVDLLISTLTIGDYNNSGAYENTFSFDTGTLDALSTSLSVLRNSNANAAVSGSTLNINGGTASLGPVVLTGSAAYGTLNINNATVSTAGITAPGTGLSTLSIANSTLNLSLTTSGNPVTAPVFAQNFSATGVVNLNVNGTGWTVGQFPLINYTGVIGGSGYSALNLASLPAGVSGYLSNNTANLTVDIVVTNAPAVINPNPTNITFSVSGNQLTLGWPADHTGWLLQSNSVSLTSTNSWFTIAGSSSTNQIFLTIDRSHTNVFFRMLKP